MKSRIERLELPERLERESNRNRPSKPIKPARSYLGGHGIGDQSRGNFRGVIGASAPGGLRSGGELRKIGPEN
jgi:hypothetical protein